MQDLIRTPPISGRGFSIERVRFDAPAQFPRHEHRTAQLTLVYAGSWLDDAQRPIELRTGDILYQPAGITHENRGEPGTDIVVADLRREFVSAICPLYGGHSATLRYHFDTFDELPARLYEEVMRNDASSALVIEAVLLQIIALGARLVGSPKTRPQWLSRVVAHIHMHAHQPLTVSALALVGAVSLSRLSHGFREHTGKSITAYIRDYRLRIAARALRQTSRPIKDIALNYGFYDHAHFSREFAKQHGIAPIEYRRRIRQQVVQSGPQRE